MAGRRRSVHCGWRRRMSMLRLTDLQTSSRSIALQRFCLLTETPGIVDGLSSELTAGTGTDATSLAAVVVCVFSVERTLNRSSGDDGHVL